MADSAFQLLLAEIVATVVRTTPSPLAGSVGEGATALSAGQPALDQPVTPSDEAEDTRQMMIAAKIEDIGHGVGYRFVERVAQGKMLSPEFLDVIKFLCKDLWGEVFGKQIDKLQTNHRGVFVLRDADFVWLARHSGPTPDFTLAATQLLNFPCGVIRGALENLGIIAVVSADFNPAVAALADKREVSFHVRITNV